MFKFMLVVIFAIPITIFTPVMYVFAFIIKKMGFSAQADKIIHSSAAFFSKLLFKVLKSNVIVEGSENIPQAKNICIISNHQSMFDIPLTIAYNPINTGFIAKKSLGKIPILNLWMSGMHCLLIDRKNLRKARKTINEGIKQIQKGYPLLIFPEGTRSRSNSMNDFRKGSLKLAIKSKCVIIPQTITNSYKLYEENKRFNSADITLKIHKPLDISKLSNEELKTLPETLYKIINKQ